MNIILYFGVGGISFLIGMMYRIQESEQVKKKLLNLWKQAEALEIQVTHLEQTLRRLKETL